MVDKLLVVFDEFNGDLERLKPYVSESSIEVTRKGWSPATQDFRTNYLLLSRDDLRDSLSDDRRFMVTSPLIALAALASLK